MFAAASVWAAQAESAPQKRPEEKRAASVQLLGVNDFHGNLEPVQNPGYTAPTGNVEGPTACGANAEGGVFAGGAAYLDAYLKKYAALDPKDTIKVHAGDMVGASPLISENRLLNFTRVGTFGSPDVHWIRARVNPRDEEVFSFEPEIVEENVVAP